MNKRLYAILAILVAGVLIHCATNIFAARYYRLLEKERPIYLGLRAIDSLAAVEYINLPSATERARFYENFWRDEESDEREKFEERIAYAYRTFGRYAPLGDDRIPIYVIYGPPSKREIIAPQQKIAVGTREVVKPAEVWTYNAHGTIFDFLRMSRAYEIIAQVDFGDKIRIPHLTEVTKDSTVEIESAPSLDFDVAIGRFRQKRNLTRLEVYFTVEIEDTTGLSFARHIRVFDKKDSLIDEKKDILIPQDGEKGVFFDEANFWLKPDRYYLEIELADIKNRKVGKKSLSVDLVEYQDDAKEIGDLIPAAIIDEAFTHEKFNKPVGRVIPLTKPVLPVHTPFYFYTEGYNLEIKDGMHRLRTAYEVYNKAKMRKEIVDVMIRDWISPGDVAYIGAQYHPMDLSPGYYIIVAKIKDLLSGKERTAVTEFELVPAE
ncbi:MAG: GWxTD domain-containing protein [candidate division WOR-3 bacterium]|nr:MAG: GWxTD domain-containing protein [candidate division WOR-3 bacterium]